MPEDSAWIVTSSGDRPLREIVKDLRETGFAVDQVLDEIGCVTGGASEGVVNKLRAIPGVADVAREGVIDIGPPDADITW